MVSSRLSTSSSFSRPWRFSCRFSFLLGVYGTKSTPLCRKTTGSSLTQKNMTSCLQDRHQIIAFVITPLPRATGNNLLSYYIQHMSKDFREAPHIILSISFQLRLQFLAAVSREIHFPLVHTTATFCLLSSTIQPQPPLST